jgi:hypothetical protein
MENQYQLCNMLTMCLCVRCFQCRKECWTGYGLSLGLFVILASAKIYRYVATSLIIMEH